MNDPTTMTAEPPTISASSILTLPTRPGVRRSDTATLYHARATLHESQAGVVRHDDVMPVYRARAEFRRVDRRSRWVLAGVRVGARFVPAVPGVEPIRGRLPDSGLVGWAPLDTPILAPDADAAAEAALDLARATWPDRARGPVPYPSGLPDPPLATSRGDG